jgi:energy-coupling factor transport system permease protein
VTWALENAIETADSMKSRGYGLKGRTAFSIYRFDKRDGRALIFLLLCAAYIVTGGFTGAVYWRYFPSMRGADAGFFPATVFIVYLAMCLTPVILNVLEDRKWTVLRSAI